jgi:hypothetical protein
MARRAPPAFFALFALIIAGCTGSGATGPATDVPGRAETTKTDVLEGGAATLQTDAPADGLDIYLAGFHPMKDEPSHQFEAHHFCRQVNQDFMQCALFDGNSEDANLNGLEYIISERLFEGLPEEEKPYWHPHNGEILSGQLIAPGLPEMAEKALMRHKMNSYGKTWHLWDTGMGDRPGDELPFGPARLAWSFSRDGELQHWLLEGRDRRMGLDTDAKRRARQDLIRLAHPQEGVDLLKDRFAGPTRDIPGVIDRRAPVPVRG